MRPRPHGQVWALIILFGSACWLAQAQHLVFPQVMGEEAELDRLEVKAQEAMANDDADGAAMSMGRAALMALRLGKRETGGLSGALLRGAEHLFRSQEHGYRALALFRRAGESLPASSGVCGSLSLARTQIQHALDQLTAIPPSAQVGEKMNERAVRWRQAAEDWTTVVSSMRRDFQCE